MKRKSFFVAIAMLASGTALFGCGSDNDPPATEPPPPPPPEPEAVVFNQFVNDQFAATADDSDPVAVDDTAFSFDDDDPNAFDDLLTNP
jgi:hypothetical protein